MAFVGRPICKGHLVLPLLLIGLILVRLHWSNDKNKGFKCSGALAATESLCLKNEFKDIVLIIGYNYPLYSSVPLLRALYQKAFPTIMFCGPERSEEYTVEVIYTHDGYFSYVCVALAIEKYPDHSGYLLINDDVLLNYWQLAPFDRTKIWEGPKSTITFRGFAPPASWYWWNSTWGMKPCQKACDEIRVLDHEDQSIGWNLDRSFKTLAKNGDGKYNCYRGRSDVFYIPRRFSLAFQTMSYIFYKHGVFIEIAVPTLCRMLDVVDNFQFISGVYLPGKAGQVPVKDAKHFWEVYNKTLGFVHPFKLHYQDASFNEALLKTWIVEYSDALTNC